VQRTIVDRNTCKLSTDLVLVKHFISEILTSSLIRCFVNANQSMAEFEHVVSQRDNYELGVLCPVLDIVRDYRDIPEV
jgi:hypothetical protein